MSCFSSDTTKAYVYHEVITQKFHMTQKKRKKGKGRKEKILDKGEKKGWGERKKYWKKKEKGGKGKKGRKEKIQEIERKKART